ncbi:uncharacterized protein KY384_001073 [Bacidia gigantensis]|uniref:uncharacterized protein n=1 Tax=Bacidia gigantensis TaxID=2732470 RepID=UPI001D04B9CA|nr:uncharacterized protein KY384_001073 [Bacidia gigantensis]KAG8534229.1 hypothetical protein KY384_001073 [Bacidia gigantensis]
MEEAVAGEPLERKLSALEELIQSPGHLRVNVQGAFIADEISWLDGTRHDISDIRLPRHTSVVSHVALDIGGSLAKLVYFSREPNSKELGGRLSFVKFETDRINQCFEFIKQLKSKQTALNGSKPNELVIIATGGGAFKYYDEMKAILGLEVLREDEMECLIMGLDFFITEIPQEVFTYSEADPMPFQQPRTDIYPYLLVNIGSGVSMIKVSGPRQYERIGGTSLGGGTLWGLLSLMTGARTFDDMLALADKGDNTKVDMLVGDIYGSDYSKIGLATNVIASSFGKVFRKKREGEKAAEDGNGMSNGDRADVEGNDKLDLAFAPEDISLSLLYTVSNNIGQIAYLFSEKHQLENIYFGGSFIRGHRQTINSLTFAVKFWSGGKKKAFFLRHEGYLGSVGAFLKRQPKNWGRRNSFEERFGS